MSSHIDCLKLWYAARDSNMGGIFVRTPDPSRLKTLLYIARTKAKDMSLAHLSIRTSPANMTGEILIVQGEEPNPNG